MKFKYIQISFIEAKNAKEALLLAEKNKPTQISLESVVEEESDNKIGFQTK